MGFFVCRREVSINRTRRGGKKSKELCTPMFYDETGLRGSCESDFVATLLLELHENWEITFGLDAGREFPGNFEEVFLQKVERGRFILEDKIRIHILNIHYICFNKKFLILRMFKIMTD